MKTAEKKKLPHRRQTEHIPSRQTIAEYLNGMVYSSAPTTAVQRTLS